MDENRDNNKYFKFYDIHRTDETLNFSERFILSQVCRYHPKPTTDSNETIASNLGTSIRTIQRAISSLRKKGKITAIYPLKRGIKEGGTYRIMHSNTLDGWNI